MSKNPSGVPTCVNFKKVFESHRVSAATILNMNGNPIQTQGSFPFSFMLHHFRLKSLVLGTRY